MVTTLALASASDETFLRVGRQVQDVLTIAAETPSTDAPVPLPVNATVAPVVQVVDAEWHLYFDIPEFQNVAGGEDFVVAVARKLANKVTNDQSLFAGISMVEAKVEKQVILQPGYSERRNLFIWNKFNIKAIIGTKLMCGIFCRKDDDDQRKLNERELIEAGEKFMKKYYISLGRKLGMVIDIQAVELVAVVPEFNLNVDIFYSPSVVV